MGGEHVQGVRDVRSPLSSLAQSSNRNFYFQKLDFWVHGPPIPLNFHN